MKKPRIVYSRMGPEAARIATHRWGVHVPFDPSLMLALGDKTVGGLLRETISSCDRSEVIAGYKQKRHGPIVEMFFNCSSLPMAMYIAHRYCRMIQRNKAAA